MKKIVISLLALAIIAIPVVALAQAPDPNFQYVDRWIVQVMRIAQQAVTFLMVLATLYFVWTVIGYIRVKDAKESEEKKKAMLRGIIGLFVIVGIWGIVRILASTLGVSGGSLNPQDTPCPPGLTYSTIEKICK